MAKISIYVTNLGKYNEGYLVGEWLELPATDEEIAATLERIGISDKPDAYGRYYEEYFITDYESDIDGFSCGEYESIAHLNEIAEQIEDIDAETFAAAYYHASNFEEAIELAKDTYCLGKCPNTMSKEEYIGYYYIEEYEAINIPENIISYFDFERYGREIEMAGHFYTAESGNIYETIR